MFENRNILFTYIFLLSFLFGSSAKASEIDSLNNVLNQTHDVKKRIEIYTSLSKLYQPSDLTKAREMAFQAVKLAKNTELGMMLGEVYGCLGDIAIMQDSIELAHIYYENALDYFEQSNDIKGLAGVTIVLGNIAYLQDDLSHAMQYYMRARDYALESGLESWIPHLDLNIGSINLKAGYFNEALEYYLKSLEGAASSDTLFIAKSFANIGIVYMNLNQYDLAGEYLQKGLDIYLRIGAGVDAGLAYSDLAQLDQQKGEHHEALKKLRLGLDVVEKSEQDYAGPKSQVLSDIYNNLGKSLLFLNKNEQAKQYFLKSYNIGLSNGQTATIGTAAKGISDYWNKINNSDSTLYYYRIYKAYSDSVTNQENIRKLAYQDAQFKYEQQLTAEKQKRKQQAEEQQRSRLVLIFVIALLVLLLMMAVLLLKLGRNKVKRIELEQQTLKKELELRNKELATHVIYQVKNNEFILNVSKKLQTAISSILPENRPLINEVIKEIEFDSSQDIWKEFEVRFQRVHSGFNRKLAKKYPDLTSNELRLCSFLRLNMNTKDISAITYQSTNSIDVARSRLRQKLGLEKDENLVSFLSQF